MLHSTLPLEYTSLLSMRLLIISIILVKIGLILTSNIAPRELPQAESYIYHTSLASVCSIRSVEQSFYKSPSQHRATVQNLADFAQNLNFYIKSFKFKFFFFILSSFLSILGHLMQLLRVFLTQYPGQIFFRRIVTAQQNLLLECLQ